MNIYMKIVSLILIGLCATSAIAQSDLEGIWETGEDNTKIEIGQLNGHLKGKIKSSDNGKATIGKVILKDLKKDGFNWTGQIYAARRGKWYNVEITPNQRILELEISAGIFSKSIVWKRN